jgi:hypothetical protein
VERIGVAAVILPGQMDRWRSMIAELKRRAPEHEASRKAKGVELEYAWLRETEDSAIVIIYREGHDLESYTMKIFESDQPFDRWFAEELRVVHGVDPELPFPRHERLF